MEHMPIWILLGQPNAIEMSIQTLVAVVSKPGDVPLLINMVNRLVFTEVANDNVEPFLEVAR